jgi:EAL domain-containing protein (putative c-di-GMP-specific phosphodiesterase class I)
LSSQIESLALAKLLKSLKQKQKNSLKLFLSANVSGVLSLRKSIAASFQSVILKEKLN